jgi:hypothetical protein
MEACRWGLDFEKRDETAKVCSTQIMPQVPNPPANLTTLSPQRVILATKCRSELTLVARCYTFYAIRV